LDMSFSVVSLPVPCEWSQWYIQIPPTCSTDGIKYRICTATDNHHRNYEVIPALVCEFEFVSEIPATCTIDGVRNYSCVYCRASRTYVVPATGHQMQVTQTPPTCERRGIKKHSCTECDYSFTEEFGEKTEHTYTSEITRQPTYDLFGVKTFTCSVCGHQRTEDIPKLVQQVPEPPMPPEEPPIENPCRFVFVSESPPSCLYDGYTKYICEECGEEKVFVLPATGQAFGDWTVYQHPTRLSAGVRHLVCANSADCLQIEVIPALINFSLNMTDAVMLPINMVLLMTLVMFLWFDIYVLLWDLGKRGKTRKSKRMKVLCGLGSVVAFGAVVIIATIAIPSLPTISFTNLLAYVFLATLFVVALIFKPVTIHKRSMLDGRRGIYQNGVHNGEIISMN